MEAPLLVAGLDGCPKGWVVVIVALGPRLRIERVQVLPRFDDIVATTEDCLAVGADIPIGLSEAAPRAADLEARRLLGRGRGSSVFPAPVRAVLACLDYRDACSASIAACGKAISWQAFNILSKIREADAAMSPLLQQRIFEAHPEVSFRAINDGVALLANKLKPEGRLDRAALLASINDASFAAARVPAGAKVDDFYDACAVAWTAARVARGESQRVPLVPAFDQRGLRMEIVY